MGETVKVIVCPLSGEEFELNVSLDMRVENFKQKVADKLRTDTDNIRILLKDKELKFGNLKENKISNECSISVLPVMRAGLVGYVTTKSSVLLKSIPDEVLENAEIKAQIRDGDQASITLHIEDMVIVFKLQLIATDPETEGSHSSSESTDFHKKFVQYLRKGSSGGSSTSSSQAPSTSKGKSDIPLSSELKKFLKDMVIKKLKSEMGMSKSDGDQSPLPPMYSKRRAGSLDSYRQNKRAKIMSQCSYGPNHPYTKLSNECERENKEMKNKIAVLKARMRQTRLQKQKKRSSLPCAWASSSKLLPAEGSPPVQPTCDPVQLAVHSVPGPSNSSYGGMKKGFLL